MIKNEEYGKIYNQNKDLIEEVIKYSCASLKIDRTTFLGDSLKNNIKEILRSIKSNNLKSVKLRLDREKIRNDLDDLERAFCSTQADIVPAGKNTGGKPNLIENRQIEKLKLKGELGDLLLEGLLLEKSLKESNRIITEAIHLIPKKNYAQVLEMTYIDCLTNTHIAIELAYSTAFVDQARKRGIIDLVQIFKCAQAENKPI